MTQEILRSLYVEYDKPTIKYRLHNSYIFELWESDFFILRKNGYCVEFEIKISRQDFFADQKKVKKHLILETGEYTYNGWIYEEANGLRTKSLQQKKRKHDLRPNKFYYVCPENMISIKEIPTYAGLIYYSSELKIIKEAPFIHKQNLESKIIPILCGKFYYYWLNCR